jgi:Ca-activated chloride channel family protein
MPEKEHGDYFWHCDTAGSQETPGMAHGGTTPPNDEDVDAQFFKNYGVNPFVDTEDDHLSTFATDTDTGSYTIARRYLHEGHVPPSEAIRVEEFVNYFKYDYAAPQEDDFAVYTEACPWQFGEGRKNSYLMRVALKAKQIEDENRKPAILTFVIDVSGSMDRENRLGLVKKSLTMLVNRLRPDDKIGIAVYGSNGRKVMDHKSLEHKQQILDAIESLRSSGSTYAEQGIRIGYEMADKAFKKGYINRVILCSDGVANVGNTGADSIFKMIKSKADKGVTLSTIGFGMGNYNDVLMEQLGNKGNGYYAYVDTIAEAKKLFEENLTGTLQVVARDVKIQVDFNPKVVRSYRLIGYENRDVPDDKFRDDKYDGGEMGAGHSATALYELKLWPDKKGAIATTYVRYKDADTFEVTEFKSEFKTSDVTESIDKCSRNFRLASTVGEFAEVLRESYWAKGATLESVLQHAQPLPNEFEGDTDVIELVDLIAKAKNLKTEIDCSEVPEDIEYMKTDTFTEP